MGDKKSVIKLYGMKMSTCTRRVRCVLEEMSLPYEIIPIDLSKGEHKQPAYLALQPFGQIPLLEDIDGAKIFESRAIIRYLVKKYPSEGAKVQPEDSKSYGQMEQWLNVESEHFNREATPLVWETLWKPKMKHLGEVDEKLVEEKKKKLESILSILDNHLATNEYFAGNQFTIADISYLPYTENLIRAGHKDLLLSKANFATWWKKCSERSSWILCKTEQEIDF
ncbi:unnamed protein product [Adineta steineri]|uniref:glutathione transferase n=1 Tax=Adineta steineri TaxID=433720 RepID=A0A814J0N8_9BILA|nr:unnamed protein product [Adineta steineri]CAF1077542.1 unnamed protein product [Adineta steineri]